MISIARIHDTNGIISAEVFENLFYHSLKDHFQFSYLPVDSVKLIFSPPGEFRYEQAVEEFSSVFGTFDYLCPSYRNYFMLPSLLSFRNSCDHSIRLLLIAHSPGIYSWDWLLLRPLLRPGDLIISPSESGKKVISFLCPEITPFVRVIHHPVGALSPSLEPGDNELGISGIGQGKQTGTFNIITFTRIVETKLIHRQIEAAAVLLSRGVDNFRMRIAGPLQDSTTGELTTYAMILMEKIRRMDLSEHVLLLGSINEIAEKGRLLAEADLSINLSNTLEETFPKASVEPLAMGVPVIAARWNGFVETLGNAGILLPLQEVRTGVLDLSPEDIADAVQKVMNEPISPERCREQADRYSPAGSISKYREELEQNVNADSSGRVNMDTYREYPGGIAETAGFLGTVTFLEPFMWKQMIDANLQFVQSCYSDSTVAEQDAGNTKQPGELPPHRDAGPEMYFRTFVHKAVQKTLERLYAGYSVDTPEFPVVPYQSREQVQFGDVILQAAVTTTYPSVLEALLESIYLKGDTALLAKVLEQADARRLLPEKSRYYSIGLHYLRGEYSSGYHMFSSYFQNAGFSEDQVEYLVLIGRICRKWKKPELSYHWLDPWIEMFPDSPGTPGVMLELVLNKIIDQSQTHEQRFSWLRRLERLVPPSPVLKSIQRMVVCDE